MLARAGVLSLLCHACAGGHLPPPVMPDPDRASRVMSPYYYQKMLVLHFFFPYAL